MWRAFFEIRPFGFVRESQLFGTLAAQQHNMNVKGRRMKPTDFFPIEVRGDGEGRDTSEYVIGLFKQHNESQQRKEP